MFLITLVMLILYVFIMKILGFATASFVFITSLMWMLTDKQGRKPVLILGVSMGITAIIYIIFKMILSIPFPQGLLI
jgi:D-alanyl-lipoteichoic acid acyltransferase DltB (MBOAT superfamily)